MIKEVLVIAVGSILSAIFYRMGGMGKDFSRGAIWNTKTRDFGCPLVFFIATLLLFPINLKLIAFTLLSSIALFGSLTTYWKSLSHRAKQNNKIKWQSWAVTGLFYGLSALPLVAAEVSLWGILVRSIALAGLVCLVSLSTKNAWIAEPIRGASIIITLPILGVK